MNEEMEAEHNEMDSIPDHLAVSEYESADEAVQINIRKERKTKAHKNKMSQDIKNIDTYETRTKFNTTKWRPIYEVIDEAYIEESNIYLRILSENVKKSNVELHIPRKVKNNIKQMAMEQSLYAQVVKLCRKDLKFVATDRNKKEAKFKFQSQSARSQLWFDLDLD